MYNSNDYKIDSTLSLNSNINWVTLRSGMHELFMSESLVNWLITARSTTLLDLPLVPPIVGTSLTNFNLVELN